MRSGKQIHRLRKTMGLPKCPYLIIGQNAESQIDQKHGNQGKIRIAQGKSGYCLEIWEKMWITEEGRLWIRA